MITQSSSAPMVSPLLHRLRVMSPTGSWWSRMGRKLTGRAMSSNRAETPWQQLLFAAGWTTDDPQRRVVSIAITGCEEGQGVSTLATQTAVSAASVNGAKCLLIDCNINRPSVPARFRVPPGPGLCDALADPDCLAGAIRPTGIDRLSVLPPGGGHRDIRRGGEEFAALIRWLRSEFDLLVLDMPPVAELSEVRSWCQHVDALMLLVSANTTEANAARRTADMLQRQGIRITGVILNRMPPSLFV